MSPLELMTSDSEIKDVKKRCTLCAYRIEVDGIINELPDEHVIDGLRRNKYLIGT